MVRTALLDTSPRHLRLVFSRTARTIGCILLFFVKTRRSTHTARCWPLAVWCKPARLTTIFKLASFQNTPQFTTTKCDWSLDLSKKKKKKKISVSVDRSHWFWYRWKALDFSYREMFPVCWQRGAHLNRAKKNHSLAVGVQRLQPFGQSAPSRVQLTDSQRSQPPFRPAFLGQFSFA